MHAVRHARLLLSREPPRPHHVLRRRLLEAGTRYTTLEVKTNFVRPITAETGVIRCEGTVIHKGSRIATAEGKVTDGTGRLLAHGTTTCLMM